LLATILTVHTASLLTNPAIFSGVFVPPCQLAEEFVTLCMRYPVAVTAARGLLVKMLLSLLQEHGDIREELVTSGSIEEMAAVVTELRQRIGSGENGLREGYTGQRPDWASSSVEPEISLVPLAGFQLWRETLAFPRAPSGKGRLGDTGGWIVLIGVGRRYLPSGSLRNLRDRLGARCWKCRDCATYMDIPDDELYREILAVKRVKVFYRLQAAPKTI
jgi:hypothetical protein